MEEGKPNQEIGMLMKKISERMEKVVNHLVKTHGLTMRQMRIVTYLAGQPGKAASQKKLEQLLCVSHPTVVTILNSMEHKGIVSCRFDALDKRTKMVYLTWGTLADYDKIRRIKEDLDRQLTRGLSREDQNRLRLFLETIYENLK